MSPQRPRKPVPPIGALAEPSVHAVIATDLSGTITAWDPAAVELFGYVPADVIGSSIRMLLPANRNGEEDVLWYRAQHGETLDHFATVRRRKNGTLVSVALTLTVVCDDHGKIVGGLRTITELQGRRDIEPDLLRLSAIVESSDDAIVGKDLNGIVMSWNRSAERIFGYKAEEIVGRSIRSIVPDDRQSEEDDVLARIRVGERVEHFDTIRRTKDGRFIPISVTVSPIYNAEGEVIGASKIARDITERREAENERARLLNLAQEAGRLKDEFLATLSHELRTPLNAILGYTRMVRSGLVTGDRQERAFETIERNATSLTQIIEEVLDVSRIISGKIRLNVRPMELPVLVREALETVRPAADAKGIHIDTAGEFVSMPISADAERLQQVLWNLVSNAVKFTGSGGRVEIRLNRVDSDAELCVTDTGIGIAAEFLPHVFERFRQADSGITREHGGLGLGLAITRNLIEMHGGTIQVSSPGKGQGATFTVRLPLMGARTRKHEGTTFKPRQRQPVEVHVPVLDGVTILAVDDEVDALLMVREILEATGAEVLTADSALEALRILELSEPDVLVADVGMPMMSGLDLIARIRESSNPRIRNLPAAALTAYARSEDRAQALSSGFQIHLAKPIDPSELMYAVASLASRRQGNDASREKVF